MADDPAGRVEAIWLKRATRGPMDPVPEATAVEASGVEGDANRGRSHRQVTIIEREVFDAIREDLAEVDPAMRRANVMVGGLRLAESRGRVLALGAVKIRIGGETRPCERMDEQCDGLRAALSPSWHGGAHGVVLEGGVMRVGDPAFFEAEE
ncbi:MAG: MOSC domain-containing protein [Gemmatimonadota bacterium]|jgi:MOSC domain-containing protein YiiM